MEKIYTIDKKDYSHSKALDLAQNPSTPSEVLDELARDKENDEYIDEFNKDFREIIPSSDLADLLLYSVHLKKVKNIELDGFDYLLEYEGEGIEEVDQYAFTNALLYIQKSKEIQMEF